MKDPERPGLQFYDGDTRSRNATRQIPVQRVCYEGSTEVDLFIGYVNVQKRSQGRARVAKERAAVG